MESPSTPSTSGVVKPLSTPADDPGVKSHEADPLQQARRRIKELETELKIVKDASAIFEEGAVDPKGSTRLSDG